MIADQSKAAKAILGIPDAAEKAEGPETPGADAGLSTASEELLEAVKSGSSARVAAALRSAFTILEAEPHEEGGED